MGGKKVLEPKKVIDTPTSNGVSAVFTAQWYPDVVAQIIPSIGAGGTVTVKLKAGLVSDINKAVELASADYDDTKHGIPQKLACAAGEWWLFYWLVISSEQTNAFVNEAYIGAGGA